jgi:hypothetical protein
MSRMSPTPKNTTSQTVMGASIPLTTRSHPEIPSNFSNFLQCHNPLMVPKTDKHQTIMVYKVDELSKTGLTKIGEISSSPLPELEITENDFLLPTKMQSLPNIEKSFFQKSLKRSMIEQLTTVTNIEKSIFSKDTWDTNSDDEEDFPATPQEVCMPIQVRILKVKMYRIPVRKRSRLEVFPESNSGEGLSPPNFLLPLFILIPPNTPSPAQTNHFFQTSTETQNAEKLQQLPTRLRTIQLKQTSTNPRRSTMETTRPKERTQTPDQNRQQPTRICTWTPNQSVDYIKMEANNPAMMKPIEVVIPRNRERARMMCIIASI